MTNSELDALAKTRFEIELEQRTTLRAAVDLFGRKNTLHVWSMGFLDGVARGAELVGQAIKDIPK